MLFVFSLILRNHIYEEPFEQQLAGAACCFFLIRFVSFPCVHFEVAFEFRLRLFTVLTLSLDLNWLRYISMVCLDFGLLLRHDTKLTIRCDDEIVI